MLSSGSCKRAGAALLLAGAAATGCVIDLDSAAAPPQSAERLVRRVVAARPGLVVEVENLAGAVRIEGHQGDVEIEATVHAAADSRAEAEELAEALTVSIAEQGDRLVARAAYPVDRFRRFYYPADGHSAVARWLGGSRTTVRYQGERVTVSSSQRNATALWVDFVIRVPEQVALQVAHRVGSVEAAGLRADLTVRAASGDIAVTGGDGSVVASTGSGDVLVRDRPGGIRADTGSGDVGISGVRGDVWAETGSGNVDLVDVDGDTVSADTGSGDIRLESVSGSIDCSTGSGDVDGEAVRVRGDLSAATGSGRISFAADLIDAAGVRLGTGSGDVDLRILGPAPSMHLIVETHSGDIDVDMPGMNTASERRGRFEGRTGGGGMTVGIDTSSGDVRVTHEG